MRIAVTSIVCLLATAACATELSAPAALTQARVAGQYAARGGDSPYGALTLTTTTSGATTDWLSLGAAIDLTLTGDGRVNGRLHLPLVDGEEDDVAGPLDVNLTGTWSLDHNRVSLAIDADTFLRDLAFEVQGTRLVGRRTFQETTVSVVLARR
jgi:hypothetical protein